MLTRTLPLALAAAIAASVSGCARGTVPGSISYYVATPVALVETRCGGGYQVYQRPGEPTILVAAYAVSEAVQTLCEQRRGIVPVPARTGVRHEEAAVEYIATRPHLKGCTVVSGLELTQLHSEFVLACPAVATGVVSVKG
ncbi:hypothetical protein [Microvirga splendida]|uniref:Lipoprotein n=1 Tax=Microvirga splendida TaxID=2795727 RepID=A0ABS0Y0J1_9HYPH|nr:hypothetical protein [Microvirga splendida]MBJ6125812.1 hypothetical protein [Microvirga splendida]